MCLKAIDTLSRDLFRLHMPLRLYFVSITATSVEGAVFNITRVNRLHMGAYLCIASNGVPPTVSKRIMLIVHCTFGYKSLDIPYFRLNHCTCSYIGSSDTNIVCWHEGNHLLYWSVLVKNWPEVPYFRVLSSCSYVMPTERGPHPCLLQDFSQELGFLQLVWEISLDQPYWGVWNADWSSVK